MNQKLTDAEFLNEHEGKEMTDDTTKLLEEAQGFLYCDLRQTRRLDQKCGCPSCKLFVRIDAHLSSGGWISVKDALPELDERVLITYPSGYDGSPLFKFGGRVDDGDGWLWGVCDLCDDIEADDDYPVTHWIRLPPLPKEK